MKDCNFVSVVAKSVTRILAVRKEAGGGGGEEGGIGNWQFSFGHISLLQTCTSYNQSEHFFGLISANFIQKSYVASKIYLKKSLVQELKSAEFLPGDSSFYDRKKMLLRIPSGARRFQFLEHNFLILQSLK